MIGISFSICCLIFLVILLIFYFSKQRLKSINNTLFTSLLIINVIGVFIDVGGFISFKYFGVDSLINIIISKVYLIYYLTYIFCFMLYIYNVSTNKLNKNLSKILAVFALIVAVIFALPIKLYFENNVGYSYGLSVNLTYTVIGIFVIIMLYYLIRNIKKVGYKKYIPLFAFLILTIITLIIQKINPEITILLLTNTIVTFLMYFTIENPDMQMLKELYKNKKIIEKSNEDTSKFMFKITQDLKNPINEIANITQDMKTMNSKEKLKEAAAYINNYTKQLDYLVNKTLNISTMDTQKLKIYENKYNVYNLFKEISYRASEEIKEPIEFKYKLDNNIPTYLYGDTIKLKHAIMSVLRIAKDFTEKGFINLEVNSIIRYNFCRLIITIEDSGRGITIDRINEILSINSEKLDKIDLNEKENQNLDIISVRKLVNTLGGSLMIKSEENKGTTVTITLDQKIVETKETEITKRLENYEQSLYSNKKVLLIDDDEKELSQITEWLEKHDINVTSSMLGKDAIEKIRIKNKYDLIILDDELSDINAINILNELLKNKNFKTPVVVMINDNKEGIKLQYLKDGFTDTISKTKLETEIDRIIKRF